MDYIAAINLQTIKPWYYPALIHYLYYL